ncbi:MAG: PhoPQ-activated protein PqaA family protein, partial [Candidatus Binatia bacterium]
MGAFVAAIFLLLLAIPARADLADYLARPEPAAGWKKLDEDRDGDVAHVQLELVSQEWRGEPWRHELDLFRPDDAAHSGVALLFVTTGRGWFADLDRERRLAAASGATVAVLGDVPNQPLFGRTEDDLIAYTFEQFLRSGDAEWPLLLPMTKSAVRAMDAIQELARAEWGRPIDR